MPRMAETSAPIIIAPSAALVAVVLDAVLDVVLKEALRCGSLLAAEAEVRML